jgi:hypothetical protein
MKYKIRYLFFTNVLVVLAPSLTDDGIEILSTSPLYENLIIDM